MKRLDLRLPADHFIFSYPSGTRTAVATVLLEVGRKLADIELRLSSIEAKLEGGNTIEKSNKSIEGLDKVEGSIVAKNILSAFD